jgi:hypothetical protein
MKPAYILMLLACTTLLSCQEGNSMQQAQTWSLIKITVIAAVTILGGLQLRKRAKDRKYNRD